MIFYILLILRIKFKKINFHTFLFIAKTIFLLKLAELDWQSDI